MGSQANSLAAFEFRLGFKIPRFREILMLTLHVRSLRLFIKAVLLQSLRAHDAADSLLDLSHAVEVASFSIIRGGRRLVSARIVGCARSSVMMPVEFITTDATYGGPDARTMSTGVMLLPFMTSDATYCGSFGGILEATFVFARCLIGAILMPPGVLAPFVIMAGVSTSIIRIVVAVAGDLIPGGLVPSKLVSASTCAVGPGGGIGLIISGVIAVVSAFVTVKQILETHVEYRVCEWLEI